MSSLSKVDKLQFTIGVIDSVTKPVNKIIAKVDQLTNKVKGGMGDMAAGAAGLLAAGMMLTSSLAPSIDSIAALGEVQSLGVAQEALTKLNSTAHKFTTEFGGNSAAVIRSAYDIQSAIAGLTGDELSQFTRASGVLAVATKADVGNITSYLGTMYGIFEKTANDIGKANWVQMVAGQTAAAVQMFKTTGPQMEQAFGRLGSAATAHGVAMHEQMAILGELQATMSGSEAATKYQAFLTGVGKAQDTLGLSFTDSQGKLLPMVDIMQRITNKYGALDTVAKKDLMMKAFGSKQAVAFIDNLIPKTAKLAQNIDALGKQKGMDKALEMATIIASPWDRLSGSVNAASSAIGQRLAPVIEPLVDMLASGFAYLVDFSEQFPVLTTVLATAAASLLGFIAIGGAFTLIMGASKVATGGFALSLLSLSTATRALTAVQWLLNAAMLANPIGLIIALVVALAAVIYKYWQPIKAFLGGFWDGFTTSFAPVFGAFERLKTAMQPVTDLLGQVFSAFAQLFLPVNQSAQAIGEASAAGELFGLIFGSIGNIIAAYIDHIVSGINTVVSIVKKLSNVAINMHAMVSDVFSSFYDSMVKIFGFDPIAMLKRGMGNALAWAEEKIGSITGAVAKLKSWLGIEETQTLDQVVQQKVMPLEQQPAITQAAIASATPGTPQFIAAHNKPAANDSVISGNIVARANASQAPYLAYNSVVNNATSQPSNKVVQLHNRVTHQSESNAINNRAQHVQNEMLNRTQMAQHHVTNKATVTNETQNRLDAFNYAAANTSHLNNAVYNANSNVFELAEQKQAAAPRIESLQQSKTMLSNPQLQQSISHHNQSSSKQMHIDSIEIKTDQPMQQTLEELMELSA